MNDLYTSIKTMFGVEAVRRLVFEWTPRVIAATLTLLAFILLIFLVTRTMKKFSKKIELDETASTFVITVTRFALTTVGILSSLTQLGINMTSVLASLGLMGLTLGFAAQNTLSNLISGIFIFWDRPFVIGDLIDVDGEYGRVETITLRSTRLITSQGKMLAIPNSIIANKAVASYTNFPNLRLDVAVTVGVNEPIHKEREVLLALCDRDIYMKTPEPAVVIKALNDYNVEYEVRVWLKDEKTHIKERLALRENMKVALDNAKVEMPFETFDINLPKQA